MRIAPLAVTLAALASLGAAPAPPSASPPAGPLIGITDDGVSAFLGVPYAGPAGGDRRWGPPPSLLRWTNPKEATSFGPACEQVLHTTDGRPWTLEYLAPADLGVEEDCLSLNIWTGAAMGAKAPAADRGVLVFIPGGGFNEGSGSVPVYNGAELAKQGVVVVTINYRLMAQGFLAHPELSAANGGSSGNQGIQDQIAALKWVHDNIRAFGGDPAKVTVAGQSAGASSVQALLVATPAKGLFARAIIESGPGQPNYVPLAQAEQAGVAALKAAGVETIAAARALSAVKARVIARSGIIADGKVIPANWATAPLVNDVPILAGFNYDEASPRKLTAQAWSDEVARRYGARAAEALAAYPSGSDAVASKSAEHEAADRRMLGLADWAAARISTRPVFAYQFTHVEPGPNSAEFGAFHTSEIPYVFKTLRLSPNRDFTALDTAVADRMSRYWVNFIKTGNPNGAGLTAWPAYAAGKTVMELGDEAKPRPILPPGAAELLKSAGR